MGTDAYKSSDSLNAARIPEVEKSIKRQASKKPVLPSKMVSLKFYS